MNISSYIEHLKTKPEYIRRRIALWSSLGLTALVFMFWFASITTIGSSAQGAIADAVDRAESPAQSFVAGVGSIFDDIKDIFIKPKKVEYQPVQVLPGSK